VRSKIEYTFGKEILGAYTRASTELNIFLLACTIYLSNLAMPQGPRQLVGLQLFNSYNILYTSIDVLAERIK